MNKVNRLILAVSLLVMLSGRLVAQTELECDKPLIENAAPTYYIGQGDVYFEGGDYARAVKAYSCALQIQPDFALVYASRGYAYAALSDSENALADYNRALELDETLTAAYNNRGALYTRLGNFGLAISDFELVIALDPSNAIAYNNRGVVHAAEQNYDLAIADFQQAIALDPAYATPHASLGAVYSALASRSYQNFVNLSGERARLPAGTPNEVLQAVDDSLRNGNFSVWLPLLTPAR
jgi:tetratricopeptide (TPR) repeat protein